MTVRRQWKVHEALLIIDVQNDYFPGGTWENFIAYYERYGSEACWAEYFNENIDVLLTDIDNPVITEEILSALIFADITEESFRKYVSSR